MTDVLYPHISVKLTGTDGNAFAVLGQMRRALSKGGVERAEIDRFFEEATAGDYNCLLATCMDWVDVS